MLYRIIIIEFNKRGLDEEILVHNINNYRLTSFFLTAAYLMESEFRVET